MLLISSESNSLSLSKDDQFSYIGCTLNDVDDVRKYLAIFHMDNMYDHYIYMFVSFQLELLKEYIKDIQIIGYMKQRPNTKKLKG